MTLTKLLLGACAMAFALPACAEITVSDPFARVSTAMSQSGAAFMAIHNAGPEDDRLIAVASDVATRVELHAHRDIGGGVMQMVAVPEGFPVPAGATHMLQRGGDHVMFMGLNETLGNGDVIHLTLTFEKAGDIAVEIPVDLMRDAPMGAMPMNGAPMQKMQGAPDGMEPMQQHQH
ncbi:MAG: copper chaperone PCu(A)C [Paracoccaceae bacterium]